MEIDFTKPLTDEAKAYLKANLPAIGKAAEGLFLDPSKPLTAADVASLKIRYKVAGQDVEESIPDALAKASKAEGAELRFRSAAEAIKFKEAHDRFVAATKESKMPADEDLTLVAAGLGVTKEQLAAGLGGGADDAEGGDKGKGNHKAAAPTIDPASPEFKAAVQKIVDEQYGKRMFPTEYHQQFNNEGFQKQTEQLLRAEIAKALAADPTIARLTAEAGTDKAKKEILGQLTQMFTSTVEQQARGRAIQIAQAGTGDIQEEIPNIVRECVKQTDPAAILAKVAPQPINFGVSEPGEVPISVLSNEKIARVPMDHPDYEANMAKTMGQMIAKQMAVGTTAGT